MLCCVLFHTGDGANAIKLFGQPTCLEAASSSDEVTGGNHEQQEWRQLKKLQQPEMLEQAAAAHGCHRKWTSTATDGEPWERLCAVENAHEADVNCVSWHPLQPNLLASCGDDGVVKLWAFNR
jgi:WD40 repeat protein